MINQEILSLPWAIQVALGSGYAAYLFAYVGIRDNHKTIDTAFIAITFGLVASIVLTISSKWLLPIPAGCLAFLCTIAAGALWRRYGRKILRSILRCFDISWSDDAPSSLATIQHDTETYVSQISVQLIDGSWLRCDDTRQFSSAPFGPCVIGQDGSVSLYLTHTNDPTGAVKQVTTTSDPNFGDRISYVPASQIRQINLRHIKNS